jgi:phosphomannomutase
VLLAPGFRRKRQAPALGCPGLPHPPQSFGPPVPAGRDSRRRVAELPGALAAGAADADHLVRGLVAQPTAEIRAAAGGVPATVQKDVM